MGGSGLAFAQTQGADLTLEQALNRARAKAPVLIAARRESKKLVRVSVALRSPAICASSAVLASLKLLLALLMIRDLSF